MTATAVSRKPVRWHIGVLLAPAAIVYTLVMIIPLIQTLGMSLFNKVTGDGTDITFTGVANYAALFGDPRWSVQFWNALVDNFHFFAIHMIVQNPIGVMLAALLSLPRLPGRGFYRTAFFLPTMLSSSSSASSGG